MQNNIVLAAALMVLAGPAIVQAGQQDALALGEPVAVQALSELRGGTDITTNDMPKPNPHTLILGIKP